ncbi:MAG: hypothetical protein QOC93_1313 [Actinomycetota bacterium]|nr:hypothetical protein [Actinomycetota bacterium]
MRLTDFWQRMEEQFGAAYASSIARDQTLPPLGSRTVEEALAEGEDPKRIWRAVCEVFDCPSHLR